MLYVITAGAGVTGTGELFHYLPVKPEIAGSSPVAPGVKGLALSQTFYFEVLPMAKLH